jgi:hypothetical protein
MRELILDLIVLRFAQKIFILSFSLTVSSWGWELSSEYTGYMGFSSPEFLEYIPQSPTNKSMVI